MYLLKNSKGVSLPEYKFVSKYTINTKWEEIFMNVTKIKLFICVQYMVGGYIYIKKKNQASSLISLA